MMLAIAGIGACGAGFADWPGLRAVLRGEAEFTPAPPPRPVPARLPATERRRANDTSRWALQVASEAVEGMSPEDVMRLPTVFASTDGDGEVLAQVLRDLAAPPVTLSPTTFHNSVYNAPAGYWSIAAHAPAASTTLCSAEGSFAAGLLEAAAQVHATARPVLLVACDLPFPTHCPIGTDARAAFACALVVAPAGGPASARLEGLTLREGDAIPLPAPLAGTFAGNGAAEALGLLHAIAGERPAGLRLPYVDSMHLAARWTPGA